MTAELPKALAERLAKQFGSGSISLLTKAFSVDRKPTFRVNTLKNTDDDVMNVLREENIQFERSKIVPHAFLIKNRTDKELLDHPLAKEGKIYLQGIASMLPPIVMFDDSIGRRPTPTANLRVLDLCAAPGSKTTEIAALMNNQGTIVACENDEIRFQKLTNTIRIQGANVEARNIDSTLLHHEMPEAFDLILADVPCSAEGRIDLNDQRSFSYWSEKNIIAHAKLQRRLLRSAVQCLKPGGTLVYSTCTLAPEENEDMIGWLISEFPAMKPQAISIAVPNIKQTAHKTITVLPSAEMEGFFLAKLIKSV